MTAARGHYQSKEFCTLEVEEEREEAEGNPNGVVYGHKARCKITQYKVLKIPLIRPRKSLYSML